jgi:hypothetical protein
MLDDRSLRSIYCDLYEPKKARILGTIDKKPVPNNARKTGRVLGPGADPRRLDRCNRHGVYGVADCSRQGSSNRETRAGTIFVPSGGSQPAKG